MNAARARRRGIGASRQRRKQALRALLRAPYHTHRAACVRGDARAEQRACAATCARGNVLMPPRTRHLRVHDGACPIDWSRPQICVCVTSNAPRRSRRAAASCRRPPRASRSFGAAPCSATRAGPRPAQTRPGRSAAPSEAGRSPCARSPADMRTARVKGTGQSRTLRFARRLRTTTRT
eukprot:5348041-Pleurochrysis_carterae.AAC.2